MKSLEVTELDFDNIKSNFIEYLKNQDEFKDYNFEGSAISTLLNVLSYNTYYQSFYLNMVANEMFLDSAQIRKSIVSRAKELNYLPQSTKSSKSIVDIVIVPGDDPKQIPLTKDIRFKSQKHDNVYFYTPEETITIRKQHDDQTGKTIYRAYDVVLVEGLKYKYYWTVDNTIKDQKFVIPNSTIDTESLVVTVKNSIKDSTTVTYTYAADTTKITDEDHVYYLQEEENYYYEIYFGDGILGKELVNGNIIEVEYISSSGGDSNGCNKFTPLDSIDGKYSDVSITTITKSFGGMDREGDKSIKFNAPKSFEGQNRIVTMRDYKHFVPKIYPNVDSVSVWGGEDNDPAYYGHVFISINPKTGYFLSDKTRKYIADELKNNWSVVAITPIVINPDYIFIEPRIHIKYDDSKTTRSSDLVKEIVASNILEFGTNISNFDNHFRYSNLLTTVEGSEKSIISNSIKIRVKKIIKPTLLIETSYNTDFNNGIKPGSIDSSAFDIGAEIISGAGNNDHYFGDDGKGNIFIYNYNFNKKTYRYKNIGTVDYVKGTIKINSLKINYFEGDFIEIFADPIDNDIYTSRNQIIVIDDDDITINLMADSVV